LGIAVAIDSEMIAAGDDCETYGLHYSEKGDTHVFLKPKHGWQNSNAGIPLRPKGGNFAAIPAVVQNTVIVGAPWTTVGGNPYQGEAFIYTIPIP
jgi:hypothetical protein